MSRHRHYPTVGPWQQVSRERRPGCTHCKKCGVEFGEKELFWLREKEVSYFRGDDEVEYFHGGCRP